MEAHPTLDNVDPAIETADEAARDKALSHQIDTYNRFIHLTGWFIVHVPLLLLGLYAMTLGGSVWGGATLIVVAIAVLIYGVITSGLST